MLGRGCFLLPEHRGERASNPKHPQDEPGDHDKGDDAKTEADPLEADLLLVQFLEVLLELLELGEGYRHFLGPRLTELPVVAGQGIIAELQSPSGLPIIA